MPKRSSIHRPIKSAAWRQVTMAALVGSSITANAQIIQNGSFEEPTIADGSLQAVTPACWTGGGVLMNPFSNGVISGNVFLWPQAADGAQFQDIGNTAQYALSQSFVIENAASYLLQWQDNVGGVPAPPGFQTAPYSVTLLDAASQAIFLGPFDSYHADGQWQIREVLRPLAAGTYTLTFTSLNIPNHTDTLIDAVQISAVPEPAAAFLLLAGLAAVACRARFSSCHVAVSVSDA